jgi:hypothetical protein
LEDILNQRGATVELNNILNFVDRSTGLRAALQENRVEIHQSLDGKIFQFSTEDVSEVLNRMDTDGRPFIQINFRDTNKVLLTDSLVGFKPSETAGLDMSRIPKVVTTPDLKSVLEAIEDTLGSDQAEHEVEVLKKVFYSILCGAEKIGFDLPFERRCLERLMATKIRASA